MSNEMPTSQAVALTPLPGDNIPATEIRAYMKAVLKTGQRIDYHQAAWEISMARQRAKK